MATDFVGRSLALSSGGLTSSCGSLAVGAPEVWAIVTVETRGCGFLADRRPPILFERHYFSRLTGGRFDASHPDISNPQPGGYGADGANQYLRLAQAIALDRQAGIESASWGLPQVMGANFAQAAFASADAMVTAMSDSEDAQLLAMVAFLRTNGLDAKLRAHDWAGLARGYNGANFAANQYDVKLAGAYKKFSSGTLPDLNVRAAQLYLTFAGVNPGPGPVDGVMGPQTSAAIRGYQMGRGLPVTGVADPATLAALVAGTATNGST